MAIAVYCTPFFRINLLCKVAIAPLAAPKRSHDSHRHKIVRIQYKLILEHLDRNIILFPIDKILVKEYPSLSLSHVFTPFNVHACIPFQFMIVFMLLFIVQPSNAFAGQMDGGRGFSFMTILL